MPKSASAASSPVATSYQKAPTDSSARMSDVALRKKKNADAQAAFRARRANYIATLEETVTSLESVVIQLQESCRDSRNEGVELRQENVRFRLEREKLWRAIYHSRKTGRPPELDDLPPPPISSPFLSDAQVAGLTSHATAGLIHHPYGNNLDYRGELGEGSSICYNATGPTNNNFGPQTCSSASFSNDEVPCDASGSSGSALNLRNVKYAPYAYSMQSSPRVGRWQVPPSIQATVAGTESRTSIHPQPTPSAYLESPSVASAEMSQYPAHFPAEEEQKVVLNSVLDNAPYVFPNSDRFPPNPTESMPNSRSMSPNSSTPSSSTSMPLTSSFQFTYHEQGQGRSDFDYRRNSLPHSSDINLHSSSPEHPLPGQTSDIAGYRLGRSVDSIANHHTLVRESNSHHGPASADGDPSLIRSRRSAVNPHSRSPSPGSASITCTVAVIKAQAFGALRRTRVRTKKSSEGAAKVAMDVLEARGMGVGIPSGNKRSRLDDDDKVETP